MYLRRFSRAGGIPASARSAVISSSKRKYCTEKPSCTAFTPRATHKCDLPTSGGPCSSTVSASRTQAQVASVSMRDRSIAGWNAKSKFSSVWPSGRLETLERGLHPPLLAAGELGGEQLPEEGMRRDLGAHRLAEKRTETLGGMTAAEREQPLTRGIDVEPGLRRAHRETSASAA
jgi:hypothetical protein